MEIPIPGKTVFILRRGPGFQCPAQWSVTETCGSPLGIWYTATERATCRRHRAAWITGTTHIGTYVSDVRNSLEINKSMVSRPCLSTPVSETEGYPRYAIWLLRAILHVTIICNNESMVGDITAWLPHDDVIKWNSFPHYRPFSGECSDHRWIPFTKDQ